MSVFDDIESMYSPKPVQVENKQGLAGDLVDLFQAGAYQGVGGIADFVGLDDAADKAYAAGREQYKTLSPEMQEAMQKQIFVSDPDAPLGFDAGDGMNWRTVAGNLAQVAGQMALPIPAGGAISVGAKGALGLRAAAKAIKADKALSPAEKAIKLADLGKTGKARVAEGISAGSMGAMTAGMAGGMSGQSVYDEIMATDYASLAQSDTFKDKVREIYTNYPEFSAEQVFATAREQIADEAENIRAYDPVAFASNAALGAIGDKFILDALFKKGAGKTFTGAAFKGGVTEGATETIQEGIDQRQTNVAMQEYADPTRDTMQDVAASAATGGLLGFGLGAPVGAIGRGIHGAPESPNPENVTPNVAPESPAASPENVQPSVVPNEQVDQDVQPSVTPDVTIAPTPTPVDVSATETFAAGYTEEEAQNDLNAPAYMRKGIQIPALGEASGTTAQPNAPTAYENLTAHGIVDTSSPMLSAGTDSGINVQRNVIRQKEMQAERAAQSNQSPYVDPREMALQDMADRERAKRALYMGENSDSIAWRQAQKDGLPNPPELSTAPSPEQLIQEAMAQGYPEAEARRIAKEALKGTFRYESGINAKQLDQDTHHFGRTLSQPAPRQDSQDVFDSALEEGKKGPLVLKTPKHNARQEKKAKKAILERLQQNMPVPDGVTEDNVDEYLTEQIPNEAMRNAFMAAMSKETTEELEATEDISPKTDGKLDYSGVRTIKDLEADGNIPEKIYAKIRKQNAQPEYDRLSDLYRGIAEAQNSRMLTFDEATREAAQEVDYRGANRLRAIAGLPPVELDGVKTKATEFYHKDAKEIRDEIQRKGGLSATAPDDKLFNSLARRVKQTPSELAAHLGYSPSGYLTLKQFKKDVSDIIMGTMTAGQLHQHPAQRALAPTEQQLDPEGFAQKEKARKAEEQAKLKAEVRAKIDADFARREAEFEAGREERERKQAEEDAKAEEYDKALMRMRGIDTSVVPELEGEPIFSGEISVGDIIAHSDIEGAAEIVAVDSNGGVRLKHLDFDGMGLSLTAEDLADMGYAAKPKQAEPESNAGVKIPEVEPFAIRMTDGLKGEVVPETRYADNKHKYVFKAENGKEYRLEKGGHKKSLFISVGDRAFNYSQVGAYNLDMAYQNANRYLSELIAEDSNADTNLRPKSVSWFVNYKASDNAGRADEIELFDKKADAVEFANGKQGFITRKYSFDKFDATKPKTEFIGAFGGYELTAEEAFNVSSSVGHSDSDFSKTIATAKPAADIGDKLVDARAKGVKQVGSMKSDIDSDSHPDPKPKDLLKVTMKGIREDGMIPVRLGRDYIVFSETEDGHIKVSVEVNGVDDSYAAEKSGFKSDAKEPVSTTYQALSEAKADYVEFVTFARNKHLGDNGDSTVDEVLADSGIAHIETDGTVEDGDIEAVQDSFYEASVNRKHTNADVYFELKPKIEEAIEKAKSQAANKGQQLKISHNQKEIDKVNAELGSLARQGKLTHKDKTRRSKLQEDFKELSRKRKDIIGTVTFDVKGNGKFKVLNTVEALEKFNKKIKAVGNGSGMRPTTPRTSFKNNNQKEMIEQFERDGEYDNARQMAADLGIEGYEPKLRDEDVPRDVWIVLPSGTTGTYTISYGSRPRTTGGETATFLGNTTMAKMELVDKRIRALKSRTPSKVQQAFDEVVNPTDPTPPTPPKKGKLDKAQTKMSEGKLAAALKLKEAIRRNKATLGSGPNFEILSAAAELAAYSIGEGAVKFAQFVRDFVQTTRSVGLDDSEVKDHIKEAYGAMQANPEKYGISDDVADQMDSLRDVRKADIDAILAEITTEDVNDVSSIDGTGKQDSQPLADGVSSADVQGDVQGQQHVSKPSNGSVPKGRNGTVSSDRTSGTSDSTDLPDSSGKGSDQPVPRNTGNRTASSSSARGQRSTGGSSVNADGNAPDTTGNGQPDNGAQSLREPELSPKAKQAAADKIKDIVLGDIDNIRQTLPNLFPPQQEDVEFVEKRFFEANGRGVHIANGTGTGKTASGLGVAKRFYNRGKTNILILAPSQEILNAWKADSSFVDLPISQLPDTKSAGKGVVMTTYGNFRMNYALADRDWDLIIADESHELQQGDKFESTQALDGVRALTYHPRGVKRLNELRHPEHAIPMYEAKSELERLAKKRKKDAPLTTKEIELQDLILDKQDKLRETLPAIEDEAFSKWANRDTKLVTLSASPWPYRKSVDAAEGYLFDYPAGDDSQAYNSKDGREKFFVERFGYRMRYNKLNEPSSEVDVDLMEREYNEWLKSEGALRARMLELDQDYDRRFELIEGGVGNIVDEGKKFLETKLNNLRDEMQNTADLGKREKAIARFDSWSVLRNVLTAANSYLRQLQLLEAIKAQAAIPYIKKHLDLGRQVVVFHDFNVGFSEEGQSYQPFNLEGQSIPPEALSAWLEFKKERPDLVAIKIDDLSNPIKTITDAYPNVAMTINGVNSKKVNAKAISAFNDDDSDARIVLVQSDKGAAGISLHDKTGAHQRVLLNIGIPSKPKTLIQTEGRVYRTGQKSDAMLRYFTTGLSFENYLFAGRIAGRAGTAENLAMGNDARALRTKIIEAYELADQWGAGFEGEGKGGKANDREGVEMDMFDKARSLYFANEKRTAKTKGQGGLDYFPTPEPIGYKMVEWLNLARGEKALEPSAGHGAIARWMPDDVNVHVVENSPELFPRLLMNATTANKAHNVNFEDFNIANKFDGIAMNPPYNYRGDKSNKMAMDHIAKAFRHLYDGGRVLAIVPAGPAFGKRFDKWLEETPTAHYSGEVKLPSGAFSRAGTGVATRIIMIDRLPKKQKPSNYFVRYDLSSHSDVKELFEAIRDLDMPEREVVEKKPDYKRAVEGRKLEVENVNGVWVVGGNTYMNRAHIKDAFKELKPTFEKKFGGLKNVWVYPEDAPDPTDAIGHNILVQDGVIEADPSFSIVRQPQTRALPTRSLANKVAMAKAVVDEFMSDAPVLVVATENQLPDAIQEYAKAREAQGSIRAVYYKGTAYVVAEHNETPDDVRKAVLHEIVGHRGLYELIGGNKSVQRELNRMALQLGGSGNILKMAKKYGINLGAYAEMTARDTAERNRAVLLDELVAHLIQEGVKLPLWRKLLNAIVFALRDKFGWNIQNVEGDILALMDAARTKGQELTTSTASDLETAPAFSLSAADSFRSKSWNDRHSVTFGDKVKREVARFRSLPVRDYLRELISRVLDHVRQGAIDRYESMRRLDVLAGVNPYETPETSAWVQARLSNASTGALSVFMNYGRLKWGEDGTTLDTIETKKGEAQGLGGLLAKLGSEAEIKTFFQWMAANRANQLAEKEAARFEAFVEAFGEEQADKYKPKYVERLFTEDEIDAGMAFNKGLMSDGRNREAVFADVHKQFQTYHNDILEIATEAGVISEASKQAWQDEFYVPFFRDMGEQDSFVALLSNGLAKQNAIKRIKGSEKGLGNLLENYILNTERLLDASLKNKAATHTITVAQEMGLVKRVGSKIAGKNATYIMANGKKAHYEFDLAAELTSEDGKLTLTGQALFESINAMNPIGLNSSALKVMRSFKRVFTNFTTSSPAFMVRNLIRDSMQSAGMEKGGGRAIDGIKAYGFGGEINHLRARMMASGGAFSFGHVYGDHADEIMASVSGELKRIPVLNPKNRKMFLRKWWDTWSSYSDSLENANRASVFNANIDDGLSAAAFRSRDLLDFSAQGSSTAMRFLISTVPFLNARVQGLDKLYRHGTDKQKRARLTTMLGAMAVASFLLHLRNMDDEDYQKLPNWQRDSYWFIKLGDNAIFIPKPFELGAVASLVERSMDQIGGEPEKDAMLKFLGTTLGNTFAFNPIPQVFKPSIEVFANYDMFRGRSIESFGDSFLPPSQVASQHTSHLARNMSAGMEEFMGKDALSGKQIDHLIRGYLGFLGTAITGLSDTTIDIATNANKPETKWYERSLIRWAYRDLNTPQHTRQQSLFYDMLSEYRIHAYAYRDLRKMGHFDDAAAYKAEHGQAIRDYKRLDRVQRAINSLRRQERLIMANKQLDAETKRQMLDTIRFKKNEYASKALTK